MSDPNNGPLMLCATRILKPPPTTIVKIGPNMNLPRPVAVRSLLAGAAGAVPGILIGLVIAGFQGLLFGLVFGAMIGVGLATWEPQKGETIGKLLGVAAQSRMRRKPLQLGGETVSLSIGIARISRVNEGYVHILPGAIPVNPNDYDERGVYRSVENRNELPLRERIAGLDGRGAFPGTDGPETQAPPEVDLGTPDIVEEPAPAIAPTFHIPTPGSAPVASEPAQKGRRRRRKDDSSPSDIDSVDLSGPQPPTLDPDHPTAATAGPATVWPDPLHPAAPVPAPTPEPEPQPTGAVGEFTIATPGSAPAADRTRKGGRRRKGRREAEAPEPAQVWPDPLEGAGPVPAPEPPRPAAPTPVAAPVPAPSPPVAAPGPSSNARKRRRDHDGEDGASVLDAWPDPLG